MKPAMPSPCGAEKRPSKRGGSVRRPATVEAWGKQEKTETVSREFLDEMARGLNQCLQLRSRNAELSALVERRDVALNMFARIMAYKEPLCAEDKRSACKHRDVEHCTGCWLKAMDKAAVQWLAKRRKEAGEQQRGTA